jgi:hypothetical protein
MGDHVVDAGVRRVGRHLAQERREVEPLTLCAGLRDGLAHRHLPIH